MYRRSLLTRILPLLAIIAPVGLRAASITVANPSFEADNFPTNPGYVGSGQNPAEITGWLGTGGRGVNGGGAGVPFADNGVIPDSSQVAFIQGAGSLSQDLNGFNVGDLYWVQGFANARNCCGDTPTVSVTLGATTLLPETTLLPVEAAGSRTLPYYFVNLPWTADATAATLTISSKATNGGDASATFDGISVIQRTAADVVVANPSFEASGLNFAFPGYTPNVAGWIRSGAGGNLAVNGDAGNLSENPFANNGIVPEGHNVVALQQTVTLEQSVTLLPGQPYRLSLDYNARTGDLIQPDALFTIDGLVAFSGTVAPVEPTGSFTLPYYHLEFDFVATNANAILSVANVHPIPDDTTLLVDNVRLISIPEPCSAALFALAAVGVHLRRSRRTPR